MSTLRATWEGLSGFKKRPSPPDYPTNVTHLFAPVDEVHQAFVALCSPEDIESLAASMYGWDDETIDSLFQKALFADHVPVTLCLDSSQAGGVHERVIVAKWPGTELGNDVVIGRSEKGAINHDKLIVINGIVTICGSTNLSAGGEEKQNNEATIVYDRAFADEAANRIQIIHRQMRAQMEASSSTR